MEQEEEAENINYTMSTATADRIHFALTITFRYGILEFNVPLDTV